MVTINYSGSFNKIFICNSQHFTHFQNYQTFVSKIALNVILNFYPPSKISRDMFSPYLKLKHGWWWRYFIMGTLAYFSISSADTRGASGQPSTFVPRLILRYSKMVILCKILRAVCAGPDIRNLILSRQIFIFKYFMVLHCFTLLVQFTRMFVEIARRIK